MLKIKDSISLSELEKFGFVFYPRKQRGGYRNAWYIGFPMDNSVVVVYEDREIEVRNRKVTLDWQPIDTLYELIKSDLVEKVENGNA